MDNKIFEKGTVTGKLDIIERNIATGEVTKEEGQNVILLDGKRKLLSYLLATPSNPTHITKIVLGTDVGDGGTVMNPIPADETLTVADQDVLYETQNHEFSSGSPTDDSVRFVATLSGEDIMNLFPDVPNVVYNSATLRYADGTAFAYRRFKPRTISSLVYVDIIWTITIH